MSNAIPEPPKVPTYWWLEDVVARHFTRLKAQVLNLIEATLTDEKQQEAVKGLVKGFVTDEFTRCIKMMREEARAAGLITGDAEPNYPPLSAYDSPKN